MNEALVEAWQRLSNGDITVLLPLEGYFLSELWSDEGFIDEESEELFDEMIDIAERFVAMGDQTGIAHYALSLAYALKGDYAGQMDNEELLEEYWTRSADCLEQAADLGLNLACRDLGSSIFHGKGLYNQNQEKGLALLEKATQIRSIPEIGLDSGAVEQEIKDHYQKCLEKYENSHSYVEADDEQDAELETEEQDFEPAKVVEVGENKRSFHKPKLFSTGYYVASILSFLGYLLVSIILRQEFGLNSAYDVFLTGNWLLGVGAMLLLNYSVLPLLMMIYFYQKDNGKHNKILLGAYIAFLVWCFVDGFLPYITAGTLGDGMNLLNAILYPAIFLVLHRVVSFLIYVFLRGKEGSSDYRIYYGLTLFAPFMVIVLLIAIPFWIFQGGSNDDYNEQQAKSERSADLKEQVRETLRHDYKHDKTAVYYDDGWKAVDYYGDDFSLKEEITADRYNTYLKKSDGKMFIIDSSCPDKDKIYYFDN